MQKLSHEILIGKIVDDESSLHKVINGLKVRNFRLPSSGSGNDLAKGLGLKKDPLEIFEQLKGILKQLNIGSEIQKTNTLLLVLVLMWLISVIMKISIKRITVFQTFTNDSSAIDKNKTTNVISVFLYL